MKRTLLISLLAYTAVSAVWCQDSSNLLTEAREAMRGISGLTVETDHNGCQDIVDRELTKQDIEVKLRIAGITVLGMMANCLPVEGRDG